jgi:hypothetical protein
LSFNQKGLYSLALLSTFLTLPLLTIAGGNFQPTTCNSPASAMQCGTGSCTPTNAVPSCSFLVTFNPPFKTVPSFVSAQYTGCHNPQCHFESQSFPAGTVVFQSDNGETWNNMPVAKTEIYGNTNHEATMAGSDNTRSASFGVNCITGSSSATAILRPEYSNNGGTSWNELASISGTLDILVDASDCSFAASPAFVTNIAGIAVGAIGQPVLLRVVGINGGGVGDNVVFNNISLQLFNVYSAPMVACIQTVSSPFVCNSPAPLSTTQMYVTITSIFARTSGDATSQSATWVAIE